jgi:hypothetical protein
VAGVRPGDAKLLSLQAVVGKGTTQVGGDCNFSGPIGCGDRIKAAIAIFIVDVDGDAEIRHRRCCRMVRQGMGAGDKRWVGRAEIRGHGGVLKKM